MFRKTKNLICKKISALTIAVLFIGVIPPHNNVHAASKETKKTQESDQQINEFSLAGFGERGKKSWDISGESADIFSEVIKLQNVTGNLYGENENVKLTADRGDFDKTAGNVKLEENVIITTSSGAKLTTDSLDWDRKNQLVMTKDAVNIVKDNMITVAEGATGKPDLNKVTLEKNVKVNINTADKKEDPSDLEKNQIIITCDGPLEIDYQNNVATFNNKVKVDTQDVQIYSNVMDVYFLKGSSDAAAADKGASGMGNKIDKIVARGNVKIVRGENISYSDEATYTQADKKIVLNGRPRLVIYSTEDINASFGN